MLSIVCSMPALPFDQSPLLLLVLLLLLLQST
jgi:hypothetical protein